MSGATTSVLWVEDDKWFFCDMTKALVGLGLVFHHARNQTEARAKIGLADRLVLDLCLGSYGDLSGLAFLEELRVAGNAIPTVVLSGQLAPDVSYRLKRLGAVDFLKGTIRDVRWLAEVIRRGGVEPLVALPGLARTNPCEQIVDALEELPEKYAESIEKIEATVVQRARDSSPSLRAAADKLGMSRQTYTAKLKKLP